MTSITHAHLRRCGSGLIVLALLVVVTPRAAHSDASQCTQASAKRGVVVLVHDLARVGSSMGPIRSRMAAAGYCVLDETYGRSPLLAIGPGGLRAVDSQVVQLDRTLDSVSRAHPRAQVHLVGHGVGSLVALRAVQRADRTSVRSLTALGPLWNGTNLLRLGDLERLSRTLGTYGLVLSLEKLLLDPVCSVCREFVTGSDFLQSLRAAGLVRPGVRQTNILSRRDGFVVPVTSGVVPGMRSIFLQDLESRNTTAHSSLPKDDLVLDLVAQAIRAAGR